MGSGGVLFVGASQERATRIRRFRFIFGIIRNDPTSKSGSDSLWESIWGTGTRVFF